MPRTPSHVFTDEERAKSQATRIAKSQNKYDRYLESLTHGMRIGAACKVAGLTYMSVYTRRQKDPEFAEAEKLAEMQASEPVEDALKEAALAGNVPAAVRWLEQRAKERWTPPAKQLEVKQTLELEVGERLERVQALMARLEERKQLRAGDIIDVEVLD